MRAILPWIVAYAAILLVWALIIVRRPGPTLWKGTSLAVLNVATVLVSAVAVGLTPAFIIFAIALIVVAIVVRDRWLLVGITAPDSTAVLERCFNQTRASSTRTADAYAMNCGDGEMTVTIRPTMGRLVNVSFVGGTGSKKARLVRNLFCKQFHSSFPTPRFRV
ncbi:MAG TPA: hypothetical protein VIH53_06965 [Gemmatimonadaceae bacterium]